MVRVQQRTDEQIVDVPMPHIEEIVEVFKTETQEQISERICVQVVNVPGPQVVGPPIMEEIAADVHQGRRRVAEGGAE